MLAKFEVVWYKILNFGHLILKVGHRAQILATLLHVSH